MFFLKVQWFKNQRQRGGSSGGGGYSGYRVVERPGLGAQSSGAKVRRNTSIIGVRTLKVK